MLVTYENRASSHKPSATATKLAMIIAYIFSS